MNSTTNLNSTLVWDPYNIALNDSTIVSNWVILSVSTLQFALFGVLIWKDLGHIFSPVNCLILTLTLCNVLSAISNVLQSLPSADATVYLAGNILFYVSYDLFEALVVYYTWQRGFPVVSLTIPLAVPYLRFAVLLCALLQATFTAFEIASFFPLSPAILSLCNAATAYLPIAFEIVAFVFDCFILVIFVRFLREKQAHEAAADAVRLAIIARFGIVSFVCFQLTMGASIGMNVTFLQEFPAISVAEFVAIYSFGLYTPMLYIFLQLGMKWALQVEKVRRSNQKRETVERAKLIANGFVSAGSQGQILSKTATVTV
ncbi:hypothetical protein BC830DRAFT_1132709 [Chytriomyces sp. MP71]|nr:hypothetical protein BC830DRAFT_1132709 [Chytriomyces sp. MP71]